MSPETVYSRFLVFFSSWTGPSFGLSHYYLMNNTIIRPIALLSDEQEYSPSAKLQGMLKPFISIELEPLSGDSDNHNLSLSFLIDQSKMIQWWRNIYGLKTTPATRPLAHLFDEVCWCCCVCTFFSVQSQNGYCDHLGLSCKSMIAFGLKALFWKC